LGVLGVGHGETTFQIDWAERPQVIDCKKLEVSPVARGFTTALTFGFVCARLQ
jgi:hypothetical protein